MYELLGEIKDTYVMNLPNSQNNSYSFELWKNEIKAFIKKLEKKFNVTITEEKLKEGIKLCNEERRVLKELYSLGKLVPPPISGYDTYKILDGANFLLQFQGMILIKFLTEQILHLIKMNRMKK